MSLKRWIRSKTPKPLLRAYHYALAIVSAWVYGRPSEKMIVIGVTGTSGKSTTCFLLARALEACGAKVGMASTILFKVGAEEKLNDKKMTMVGRFQLQKLLRDMVDAGCTYAIVETTSEGIVQYRHAGIHYDVCVFTNLYPEHIESHGSFEAYKAAKLRLFAHLARGRTKRLLGTQVPRVIVANADDSHAGDFLAFPVDKKVHVRPSEHHLNLTMLGEHNQINAQLALAVGMELGFDGNKLTSALEKVPGVPGRLERIDEGQTFSVIVDYAFEPVALKKLYAAIQQVPHRRIIHVTGAAGGGRDIARRPKVGAWIGEHADVMIVTNEDPYDDDPMEIMRQVAEGSQQVPASTRAEVRIIPDRGEAIATALMEAHPDDLVLVTGKGSEQAIVGPQGVLTPWDDRVCIREILRHL